MHSESFLFSYFIDIFMQLQQTVEKDFSQEKWTLSEQTKFIHLLSDFVL